MDFASAPDDILGAICKRVWNPTVCTSVCTRWAEYFRDHPDVKFLLMTKTESCSMCMAACPKKYFNLYADHSEIVLNGLINSGNIALFDYIASTTATPMKVTYMYGLNKRCTLEMFERMLARCYVSTRVWNRFVCHVYMADRLDLHRFVMEKVPLDNYVKRYKMLKHVHGKTLEHVYGELTEGEKIEQFITIINGGIDYMSRIVSAYGLPSANTANHYAFLAAALAKYGDDDAAYRILFDAGLRVPGLVRAVESAKFCPGQN